MNSNNKTPTGNRLFRSEENRVIAGICGGLGDFFQVDATVIRLIFIVITVFGGGGILLYLILWLIIPSQGSSSEITRQNIEKGVDEIKNKAREFTKEMKINHGNLSSKQLLGAVILSIGVLLLLDNFGIVNIFRLWKYVPALAIIYFGIMILRKRE